MVKRIKARRAARWLLEQWGYGPVFAVLTVVSLFNVKSEFDAAVASQLAEMAQDGAR